MEQFLFQLDLSILLWDQLLNSELYKDLCKVIIEFTVVVAALTEQIRLVENGST